MDNRAITNAYFEAFPYDKNMVISMLLTLSLEASIPLFYTSSRELSDYLIPPSLHPFDSKHLVKIHGLTVGPGIHRLRERRIRYKLEVHEAAITLDHDHEFTGSTYFFRKAGVEWEYIQKKGVHWGTYVSLPKVTTP